MSQLAVTAIGADRPGIIARVTGVLLDRGGNIEDASMTILGSQFAIMLLVETDDEPEAVERALAAATADLGLVVAVRGLGSGGSPSPPSHVLSVYGTDRPGIVHAVATALADRGVNVTDLNTRVLPGEKPVYAMMLEVALPDDLAGDDLRDAVAAAVPDVEVSVHPLDAETL